MSRLVSLVLACATLVLLLSRNLPAAAQEQDKKTSPAEVVAPYLDSMTLFVVHVDLRKIDWPKTIDALNEKAKNGDAKAEGFDSARQPIEEWQAAMLKAGLHEFYLVVSAADFADGPFLVVPTSDPAQAEKITPLVIRGPRSDPADEAAMEVYKEMGRIIRGHLVIGKRSTLERIEGLEPVPHEQLAPALAAAGDGAVQLVLLLSDDSRRVIRETLPRLPRPFDDYSGSDLVDGLTYAALGLSFPPEPSLRLVVQSKDAASAARLQKLIETARTELGRTPRLREMVPQVDEWSKILIPQQQDDRLVLSLAKKDQGIDTLLALLAPPLEAARSAAHRMRSMNSLRQLVLAMHLYHDAYKSFPPATTTDAEGRPLLSWRVQLLPYLEQRELYDQFHHDEPWDSEHNRKLIEKMPSVFENPGMTLKPGHTAYLAPTGEKLIFHKDRKTSLVQITDGSSNTLLVVEAHADKAVPWTKPDDLAVDLDKPLDGLKSARGEGFLAAMADGSVRYIVNAIDVDTLRWLFMHADNQPVVLP